MRAAMASILVPQEPSGRGSAQDEAEEEEDPGLTVLAGTLSQLVMGILTSFCFFALLLNQWPYRLAQDNYLRKH